LFFRRQGFPAAPGKPEGLHYIKPRNVTIARAHGRTETPLRRRSEDQKELFFKKASSELLISWFHDGDVRA
jgi:hypothetical protein